MTAKVRGRDTGQTTYEKRVRGRGTGQHTRKELEEEILDNIREKS
jgi:hypothetical protein